jgi:hypothetical protein
VTPVGTSEIGQGWVSADRLDPSEAADCISAAKLPLGRSPLPDTSINSGKRSKSYKSLMNAMA